MIVALLLATALLPPTTAANRAEAQRDATALLQQVILPASARRLAHPPGHAAGLLASPAGGSASPVQASRSRLYRAELSFDSTVAFLKAHAPRGSRLTAQGWAGGRHTPRNEELTFSFPAFAGRLSLRDLVLTAAALPDGSTGIRVDSQVVWIVTRPPSEAVPAGVREVDVGSRAVSHGVTRPTRVAEIVRWFDALPIVQPGAAFSCPMLVYGPVVTLDFRGGSGALEAQARMPMRLHDGSLLSTPCTSIQFSVGGREQTPLVGGRFLVRVERLLGIRLR
jgi:hypothetical protein